MKPVRPVKTHRQHTESKRSGNFIPVLGLKELILLFRQLGTLLQSGMSIIEALGVIHSQSVSRRLKRVLMYLEKEVTRGSSLSAAFAQSPHTFPRVVSSLTQVGEKTGHLDEAFQTLVTFFENSLRIRSKTINSLIYPMFVLIAATFILPFPAFFMGESQTPLIDYLSCNLFPLSGIALLIWVFSLIKPYLRKSKSLQYSFDLALFHLPLLGNTLQKISLSRFLYIFAATFDAGLNVDDILDLSIEVVSSIPMQKRLRIAGEQIDRGMPITQALASTQLFPPFVLSLIHSGETSGNIDESMRVAARHLEEESVTSLNRILVLLGPIVLLLAAGFLGYKIVSFYLDYFGKINAFNP